MRKLITTALTATVLGFAAPAAAETWDMPTPYPDGNFQTKNVYWFADRVKELSGGELEINVHSAASLFKMPEIKRAVRSQQAPIGEVLMSVHGNENALWEVDGIPFLAAGYDNAWNLWQAQKPLITELMAEENLMPLYTVAWPGQGLYTQTELSSLDAMDGVKFRAYNAATSRMAELMGAIPTTVQYAEVPQAFSTGLVSAMLTSGATGVDVKAWDFLDVYYDTKAMHPKNMVFVNKRSFDALDEDVQKALLQAAEEAEKRGWDESKKVAAETVQTLADNGVKVPEAGKDLVDGLKGVGETMTKEWLERAGDKGEELVKSYRSM
jgi:TRAP-type C4-dicarboxylate transport system substrate-binding protein